MFFSVRIFILLLILSTCFGCGAQKIIDGITGADADNTEPPSELTDFSETIQLNKIWTRDIGKGADELFIKLVPVVLDDKIFIADTRGNIFGLYADTGKDIWHIDSELSITGGLGADKNLIMLGTSEGEALGLSVETGEEIWRSRVSSEILSSPKEADGVVVIRTIDGKIFALDAKSGKRLWVYDRSVPTLTLRGTSTPVIANGLIIAGFDGGRVTALELKTGKLVWETKAAIARGRNELERMVDIDTQPLIVDDIIYVAAFQANVSAISLTNGQILWQRDISSHLELGADSVNLYVADETGNVWALDRFSGASVWKQEKLTHRQLTGAAVLGDNVIVGDMEGYLHWLDKTTGDISARTQMDDEAILTQPIVLNDTLFAYSSSGTLSAFTYYDIESKNAPIKTVVKEQTATVADENETKEASKEKPKKEKKGFFSAILDIFTGDPDEQE